MKRFIAGALSAGAFVLTGHPLAAQDYDFVPVDQTILDTVSRQLPEARAVGAEFLSESYFPSLTLSANSQISTTFVSEGAGYRNSVGYFVYDDGAFDGLTFGDIDTNGSGRIGPSEIGSLSGVSAMDLMFPNFSASGSGGSLNTGDTVVFGGGSIDAISSTEWTMSNGAVFEAGSNVGFFLSANAWNGSGVNGWDNNADPNTYWSLDFLNPENAADATVDDVSRNTRHIAMLNVSDANQIVVGFEDLNRATGDNDFNDAVFIVRSDPVEALNDSPIPKISAAPLPHLNALAVIGLVAAVGAARRRRTGAPK